MSATLAISPRKIAFVEHAGSRPKKGLGKADDIGEETGKCTRWDRRDWGPGIWGKSCGDNIGNIPLAAGAGWQPAKTPETVTVRDLLPIRFGLFSRLIFRF